MTHLTRALAVAVLGVSTILVTSVSSPAAASEPAADLCLERDPVHVDGRQVVPAMRYCIPTP